MNILLEDFKTPFTTAPFSKIKNEDYKPAFEQAIANAKKEIDEIVNSKETPSFTNTVEALEFSGAQLSRISSIFFNLNSAETNEEIQKIAQEVSPLLSEFSNDIRLNAGLFERVKAVYENRANLELSEEQEMLLENQYKSFSRNGANLSDSEKEALRAIDMQLSQLSLKFGENVLAETNAFELHITDEADIEGLPEGEKEAAALLAKQKEKNGWVITLDYPSYVPFMTYAKNRELRKKLALAFGSKGFQNNAFDNQKNVIDIANLRHKRANLLGYESHAHFVLEERMAESPENVWEFLNTLLEKAKPAAEKEFKQLSDFAKELDGIDQIEKWDSAYYTEKLKKELFDFDEEALKPYFELDSALAGVFEIANRLFDLNFKEVDNIDKYHGDVKTFEVTDNDGNFISVFYADFHPRAGKRNGAWMTSYKSQWKKDGENSRPHISIVCNFTKPTETKPSLLTFNELTTLFHEFGHALHGMLANTIYPSLSGTSVRWDFVELPSQILENWCFEKEALDIFAKHFEDNSAIPIELIDKIKKAASFMEGMATLRQLSFGILDMTWHSQNPKNITNVKDLESKAFESTSFYPAVPGNCMSTAFSHIFQGGYSAGYYSYKWAEVLDADAFEAFKEKGIFNKDVADRFKNNVLSQGGTQKPMDLYIKFRGKKPTNEALLQRAGLK